MNTKLMMSIQIASIAALTTILAASAIISTTANHNALAKGDKCFTEQSKDSSSTFTLCGLTQEEKQDLKKECRENTDDRCSSSQTGNGEFGNSYKP